MYIQCIYNIECIRMYEWDEVKNQSNQKKHGISFNEAVEALKGFTINKIDNRFDYNETRIISIGKIEHSLIVTIVHTDRQGITRIISSRKANKLEKADYIKAYMEHEKHD
jgi:uncharacterized DUF497 family protein